MTRRRQYLYGPDGLPTHKLVIHSGQLVAMVIRRAAVPNKRAAHKKRQRRVAERAAKQKSGGSK